MRHRPLASIAYSYWCLEFLELKPGPHSFSLLLLWILQTKMCPWFSRGRCDRGPSCQFAHNTMELRATPDLRRTSLCPRLKQLGRCINRDCSYAHQPQELRATGCVTVAFHIVAPALLMLWMYLGAGAKVVTVICLCFSCTQSEFMLLSIRSFFAFPYFVICLQ